MLESTIVLLGDLLLSALTLLMGSCVVGSIVAAVRAVSHGSTTASARRWRRGFVGSRCWRLRFQI